MPGGPDQPVLGGVEQKIGAGSGQGAPFGQSSPYSTQGAAAQTQAFPPFIASVTVVYTPSVPEVTAGFISSVSAVYTPTVAYTGSLPVLTLPGTYSWVCPPGVTQAEVECIGGAGNGGGSGSVTAGRGGGGGAYSARLAVPVTPGTTYTFVVGAGGAAPPDNGSSHDGTSSSFTGDSGVQVIAVGGTGVRDTGSGGAGGAAASCTGDTGMKFSGGNGGGGGTGDLGAGGGASGNRLATGANGAAPVLPNNGLGGVGANGGGSGGDGGTNAQTDGFPGQAPGGGGGGARTGNHGGSKGGDGGVTITPGLVAPFISSVTVVYTPIVSTPSILVPFISSVTTVYAPAIANLIYPPFIPSVTVVYTPSLPEVAVPFISSNTHVWNIFSTFDPNRTFGGPGNGGESFGVRLAPGGGGSTATLASSFGAGGVSTISLSGDGGLPASSPFVVTIDGEVMLIAQISPGNYQIRLRALSNTTASSHTAGATVTWSDSYDLAISAGSALAHNFTADINSTGSFNYEGWLICFDSSQAYLAGDRYPFHVTEFVGVFDAGAGTTGTNRLDGPQPNAICTPVGVSDDCPAALSNPALMTSDVDVGDVAVLRYTNPEGVELDLGPRSVALQSWYGMKRVDTSNNDVTLTNPNGIVIDTTGTYGTYTGSVNGEWPDPVPLVTGIAPDASDLAGTPIPTPNPVPWTTVTLDHTDRLFTVDSGHGGFDDQGWPICCLAVRQGNRRVPYWQSWDWHNFAFVYDGFGTDCTYCQILINRNGIVFDSVPSFDLPNNADIDGPDAVWDDGTYYFGASWYVALFAAPYLVAGPAIGGDWTPGAPGTPPPIVPWVGFGSGPTPGTPIIVIPTIEGGAGGGIAPPLSGLHVWQKSGGF